MSFPYLIEFGESTQHCFDIYCSKWPENLSIKRGTNHAIGDHWSLFDWFSGAVNGSLAEKVNRKVGQGHYCLIN